MNRSTWLVAGCANHSEFAVENDNQKASYAMGYQTGQMFSKGASEQGIDTEIFIEAMRAALSGSEDLPMTTEEMSAASEQHKQRIAAEQEAERTRLSEAALEEGRQFRETFSQRPGVVRLENGILYEPLVSSSSGRHPTVEDTVVAHYEGALVDGSVFDSSIERGEPASFPLSRVIPGWQEALPLMQEGDKWKIVIPPELAYGERGAGAKIGPNSTLIFEVELIEVKPAT